MTQSTPKQSVSNQANTLQNNMEQVIAALRKYLDSFCYYQFRMNTHPKFEKIDWHETESGKISVTVTTGKLKNYFDFADTEFQQTSLGATYFTGVFMLTIDEDSFELLRNIDTNNLVDVEFKVSMIMYIRAQRDYEADGGIVRQSVVAPPYSITDNLIFTMDWSAAKDTDKRYTHNIGVSSETLPQYYTSYKF